MGLLVVFIVSVAIGQAISIVIGLNVERVYSPYTGLIAFVVCFFLTFGVAWKLSVWLTEPGKRLGRWLNRGRAWLVGALGSRLCPEWLWEFAAAVD